MGINLDGVVFGVHAALPVLRRRGGGSIVATASMAGLTGTPFDPAYGANKHAVVGLVRALGPAYAAQGIRVNAFCPGFAETGIITGIKPALQKSGVPIIPVDVAGRAVLQAFDSSETGQAFLLQAGREPMVYKFRGIPGPLTDEGQKASPADPQGPADRHGRAAARVVAPPHHRRRPLDEGPASSCVAPDVGTPRR
jgi:NAD(P)-dependent dehydrogenase (short-subunit alcohol dehydrogenase family)